MKRFAFVIVIIILMLSLSISIEDRCLAQQKDPVRFKVINTFQLDFGDIKKAQLIQFEMDPAAEVKNFKCASSEILWVTEGVFTYKYGDEIVKKNKGDSWFHSEGTLLDVSNTGGTTAILRGVQFLKTK
jgi:hypothetical protein